MTYFTNQRLPEEMRDFTLSSGKEEMLCSREVLSNRFSFLASVLEDEDLKEIDIEGLDFYAFELIKLAHCDISCLSKLIYNKDIVKYLMMGERLGVNKVVQYHLVDQLMSLDDDLKPILDNMFIINQYRNHQESSFDTKLIDFCFEEKPLLETVYQLFPNMNFETYDKLKEQYPDFDPKFKLPLIDLFNINSKDYLPAFQDQLLEFIRQCENPDSLEEWIIVHHLNFYKIVPNVNNEENPLGIDIDRKLLDKFGIPHEYGLMSRVKNNPYKLEEIIEPSPNSVQVDKITLDHIPISYLADLNLPTSKVMYLPSNFEQIKESFLLKHPEAEIIFHIIETNTHISEFKEEFAEYGPQLEYSLVRQFKDPKFQKIYSTLVFNS
jgi:hypothetical protein